MNLLTSQRPSLFTHAVATLKIRPDLVPCWLDKEESVSLPIPAIYPCRVDVEPLLSFIVGGEVYPAIWENGGRIFFSFDYKETLEFIRAEKYCRFKRPWLSYLPFSYHGIPVPIRRFLADLLTKRRIKQTFPSFPIEKALHTLIYVVEHCQSSFDAEALKASRGWPEGKQYCVVLTHDVDTQKGIDRVREIWELEGLYGLKSSWNVVGRLFENNQHVIDFLFDRGCEIGLHGSDHSLRQAYQSIQAISKNLQKCEKFLNRYQIHGFRSPHYMRSSNLLSALPHFFMYDSSIPDVDTFSLGVSRAGACTILPYRIGPLMELPVTIPYEIILHMGYRAEDLSAFWIKKIEWIKEAGGMILVNSHPEPQYLGDNQVLKAYQNLLKTLAGDDCAWYALPIEVATYYSETVRSDINYKSYQGGFWRSV